MGATFALGAGAANEDEDTANARVTFTIAKLLFMTECLTTPATAILIPE